ncbi:MAG: Asp-tRNA(Asn)/Glu-tRNA(Gln) amidotransferase subunit GatC [bacterium]|nr:Asp-tRNA(Asn)/Glu-tRNA(Gln) amidotransferase subunit GatC [bacterium]
MPRLDDRALDALARLARLDLSGVDRDALRSDLESVLGYVDRLAAFDEPGTEPLRHPALGDAAASLDAGALRPDAPLPGLPTDALAALAPAWRDGWVEVPRTVDQDA